MLCSTPYLVIRCEAPILSPFQHLQPRGREVQFGQGAILQHTANPTPLFEHEHERTNAERRTPNAKREVPAEARLRCYALDPNSFVR